MLRPAVLLTQEFMVREFGGGKRIRAGVKSGRILRYGYRRGDKKASRRSSPEQMSPFFGSTMALRQRGLHSSHAREERRAYERGGGGGKTTARPSARGSRSYVGNFQASGFPGKFMARSQLGSP